MKNMLLILIFMFIIISLYLVFTSESPNFSNYSKIGQNERIIQLIKNK